MHKPCRISRLSVRQQSSEAAVSARQYSGYWLECGNRKCGFPARVPCSPPGAGHDSGCKFPLLFACPVCLRVNSYSSNDLREVQFRSPDPYESGKLVLYSVLVGCARPGCQEQAAVMTAAASSVSLATLVRCWKAWKVNFSCDTRHRFRPRHPNTWWIEQKKYLAWPEGIRGLST